MENFKSSSLYKQNQIRNKVEKLNKAEIWALERKIKVVNKESYYFNAMLIREKKQIELKLKEIQRTSGRSIMGLKPSPQDKHIKDSPLFNTGIILSEKQFQSWRLKEKSIQERYKIKELERLQELNRQRSLIQLLKDLNIISEKVVIYSDENETANSCPQFQSATHPKRFPLIYERIIKKTSMTNEIPRPMTVDYVNVQKQYVDVTTKMINLNEMNLKDLQSFVLPERKLLFPERLVDLRNKRSKSAPATKQSNHVNRTPLVTYPISKFSKIDSAPSKEKKLIKKHNEKIEESKDSPDNQTEQFLPSGFSHLPKWKRQLLIEAPIGLNDSLMKSKVHVLMSQAQKRRDLENLIANNDIDVDKLAKEISEEQKRKFDNMHATLKELDEMEREMQKISV